MSSSTPPVRTAAIFGATGEVGKHVLATLLASPSISTVHDFTRRSPDPSVETNNKQRQIKLDFEALLQGNQEEMQKVAAIKADLVYITLGTTRATAGSAAQFVKIDRDYVVAAAAAAKDGSKKQTIVYCSSAGASATSYLPYPQSKGLTEIALAKLDYDETLIFRPGMLHVPGGRAENRLVERAASVVTSFLSNFTGSLSIDTPILGRAMVNATMLSRAELLSKGLAQTRSLGGKEVVLVGNAEAGRLGLEKL